VTIPPDAWLTVHFVDVGQGDGIWIQTHDDGIEGNGIFEGRNIILDGGPDSSDTKNAMLAYLRTVAHENALIDALIVTHPHIDHYAGADGILRHFEVRTFYDPGLPDSGPSYAQFFAAVRAETAEGHPVQVMSGKAEFQPLEWGRELQAEILYSYSGDPAGLGSGNTLTNNSSIVLRLSYGAHSFLFMGDAEGKKRDQSPDEARFVERILLNSVPADKLRATVLKVGHHGSETSSTLPFLKAVNPQIVVACSGRKAFGGTFLPDDSTLRRYCCHNAGIRILRTDANDEAEGRTTATDADGDNIVIRTNGSTLEVQALENGQPLTISECQPACQP
jgi:beta-lactamase superfamily II metal-dependent hydrolase